MGHEVEPFIPRDADQARMYVCGPTVYPHADIGDARVAVVFDVVAWLLRGQMPKLPYAPRTITDVGDKIVAAGRREAGGCLGLLQQNPIAWAHAGAGEVDQIEALVAERAQVRLDRDWKPADTVRDELSKLGVEVEDSIGQGSWRMCI